MLYAYLCKLSLSFPSPGSSHISLTKCCPHRPRSNLGQGVRRKAAGTLLQSSYNVLVFHVFSGIAARWCMFTTSPLDPCQHIPHAVLGHLWPRPCLHVCYCDDVAATVQGCSPCRAQMLLQLREPRPPAVGLARADIQLLHALSLAKLPPADIQAVAQVRRCFRTLWDAAKWTRNPASR